MFDSCYQKSVKSCIIYVTGTQPLLERGITMKRAKRFLSIIMSIVMLFGISINAYAESSFLNTVESNGENILSNYSDMMTKIYFRQDLNIEQQNELRCDLLRQCKNELVDNGYEAYLVDSENYNQTEQMLNTDLSDMGIKEGYTYLILFDNEGDSNSSNVASRMTTGSTFTYTYNNVTYSMRYCTVTAADDSSFAKASYCDLLTSASETLIQNCLDTAISAYIYAVSTSLGTVASICGLSISDFAPTKTTSLVLNCGTNWTRVYTQIYSDYDGAWMNGSCVEYVKLSSYLSGYYYDASINSMTAIPGDKSERTKYSSEYYDYAWRKEKAAISLINGNGCNYNITGSVSYYYGDTEKITHSENF